MYLNLLSMQISRLCLGSHLPIWYGITFLATFCLSDLQELHLLRFLQQITSFCLYLCNTFPSVVTHTGFRISSWSVMFSSSAYLIYLAASFTSDWWPDTTAYSSNSLTDSTVWSVIWHNFSSDLILVSLYSCSTDHGLYPLSPSVDITKKSG